MTSLEGRPLSAGDSGYQRIRSDIIFGVLTPSVRLKLDAMKEDYGVSISTLREILNRLTSEGFVVAEGQRVRATGTVAEANGLTQITASTAGAVVVATRSAEPARGSTR